MRSGAVIRKGQWEEEEDLISMASGPFVTSQFQPHPQEGLVPVGILVTPEDGQLRATQPSSGKKGQKEEEEGARKGPCGSTLQSERSKMEGESGGLNWTEETRPCNSH